MGGGITVGGNPPTKPVSQYTVIGTSQPMATIPPIATGTATFVGNLVLPEMLHARMVKPKTFGSTLISVGQLDKKQFPNTQIVVKGNLVAAFSIRTSTRRFRPLRSSRRRRSGPTGPTCREAGTSASTCARVPTTRLPRRP